MLPCIIRTTGRASGTGGQRHTDAQKPSGVIWMKHRPLSRCFSRGDKHRQNAYLLETYTKRIERERSNEPGIDSVRAAGGCSDRAFRWTDTEARWRIRGVLKGFKLRSRMERHCQRGRTVTHDRGAAPLVVRGETGRGVEVEKARTSVASALCGQAFTPCQACAERYGLPAQPHFHEAGTGVRAPAPGGFVSTTERRAVQKGPTGTRKSIGKSFWVINTV